MNTLQIELELRKGIKMMVTEFFAQEIEGSGKEQLMAISSFDLNNFAYIFPTKESFITEFQNFKRLLTNWFGIENQENLLAIKLEVLNFKIISNFGLDIVKKIQNELIEYLLSLKLYERDKTTSIVWNLSYIRSSWKRKKQIKKYQRMREVYETEIREMFEIYPCLWLIPFISENGAAVIK